MLLSKKLELLDRGRQSLNIQSNPVWRINPADMSSVHIGLLQLNLFSGQVNRGGQTAVTIGGLGSLQHQQKKQVRVPA